MPEKIILEDGSEREVPTEEEMTGFTEGQKTLETAQANIAKLGLGEGQTVDDYIKAQEEQKHPNYDNIVKMRDAIKRRDDILKGKGILVDEDGNPVSGAVTQEEVAKQVEDGVEKALLKNKREGYLSKYSEDDRKIVEASLNKLMALGGSLEENLTLVEQKVFPDRSDMPMKQIINSSGGAPQFKEKGDEDYSESAGGKGLAGAMGLEQSKKTQQ